MLPARKTFGLLAFPLSGVVLAGLVGCSSAPTPEPGVDAGVGTTASCGEPAPPIYDGAPMGWASVADLGVEGTTGGEGGEIVDVSTTQDFILANERVEPLVIRVTGTIGDSRRLAIGSNKTILGAGDRP